MLGLFLNLFLKFPCLSCSVSSIAGHPVVMYLHCAVTIIVPRGARLKYNCSTIQTIYDESVINTYIQTHSTEGSQFSYNLISITNKELIY